MTSTEFARKQQALGLCKHCTIPAAPNRVLCEQHLEAETVRRHNRWVARESAGLCIRCSTENLPIQALPTSIYCQSCLDKRTQWKWNLRLEVIAGYGGKCQCVGCEVTASEFLSIDHKNNDGAKRRKELGHKERGTTLYRRLIVEGFPTEYQLLCYNCNNAKQIFGKCPHAAVIKAAQAAAGGK